MFCIEGLLMSVVSSQCRYSTGRERPNQTHGFNIQVETNIIRPFNCFNKAAIVALLS
jgi:hypothetical protein